MMRRNLMLITIEAQRVLKMVRGGSNIDYFLQLWLNLNSNTVFISMIAFEDSLVNMLV